MDCTPEAPRAGKAAHGLSYPDVYPADSRAPALAAQMSGKEGEWFSWGNG